MKILKGKAKLLTLAGHEMAVYTDEFWTSRQRQASSLHEISYRACFKPQLPRYFIERLTQPGDVVYDPFSGRGTTAIEAALLGRQVIANDANPLSAILSFPRLYPPDLVEIKERLHQIPNKTPSHNAPDLEMFYHPKTFEEIWSLRAYLKSRVKSGKEDGVDRWIRMVATNRLTGHSPGFFSVYTLPPNQAVSAERQKEINRGRKQKATYRDVHALILRKSHQLTRNLTELQKSNLKRALTTALFTCGPASRVESVPSNHVHLTVTSPPFLDIVQYSSDNWLRCWFNDIDVKAIASGITMSRTVEEWSGIMQSVFHELFRMTRRGGWVAFEVGEVRNGRIKLEEVAVPLGLKAGFACPAVFINRQKFTKTANIWGVKNNTAGTNTNRIALFQKPHA